MVYICVVNPAILAAGGIPAGAAFTATCLSAAFGCILMGLLAGLPVALAPGMGINAFIAYTLCQSMAWQTAIGCVAVSGVIFLGISLTPLREKLIEAIPDSLRRGAAAGIGVLLGLVGLKNASIVAANPATIVGEGALGSPPALIAVAGLAVIVALEGRRVAGSVLVAVACCAAGAVGLGLHPWEGVFASPPSLAPTLLVADWRAALEPGMLAAILALLWSDFFDTAGTLVGVTRAIPGPDGDIKPAQMRKAMLADAVATLLGACVGTSTVTSFAESAAGVAVGARTGLAACTTGVLFLVALFFYPLTSSVAPFATTPALLFVAASMMKALAGLDWDDVTEWVPAITTVLGIGLCFSIASGVGIGAIVYVIGKFLSGRQRDIPLGLALVAVLFVLKVALLPQS